MVLLLLLLLVREIKHLFALTPYLRSSRICLFLHFLFLRIAAVALLIFIWKQIWLKASSERLADAAKLVLCPQVLIERIIIVIIVHERHWSH